MRKRIFKVAILLIPVCLLSLGFYFIFSIRHTVQKTLANERARLIDKDHVPFEKKTLTPTSSQYIQIIQNTHEVRDIANFEGSYFAATSGGLIQISYDRNMVKHFTVLDGLPESDLTHLAVFNGKLFIGTQTKGLITFDGKKFESYTWPDRKPQAITAFLQKDSSLFIGTFNGGMLRYDGSNFTEIRPENNRISAVNCISKDGPRVYIGTFNNGLWTYENDLWTHFTTAEGLSSNRVVGVAVTGGKLYAATDFGLSVLDEQRFIDIATIPSLSGMVLFGNELLVVKDDGEVKALSTTLKDISDRGGLQNSRLMLMDEKPWLVSDQGVFEIDRARVRPFMAEQHNDLTDNFVSSIALDDSGNIWTGTFRNGIDLLSSGGERIRHLETDNLREVNYLRMDGDIVQAATTNGLIDILKNFSISKVVSKKDGLPSNSINHYSNSVIATAKGLVFRDSERFRVLSTVQGLPSNSTYTVLDIGDKSYVGTLGGLAEIQNNRVVRTFKDSNSGLTTNWVTSLCAAGGRLFIGTYGGGVFELLPSGEIHSFEPEIGKFTVNPNAMFSDGERLFVGTLDGVRILDLKNLSWQAVRRVLPSETVMSIAGNDSAIYLGTTSGIAKIDKSYFNNNESE